MLKTYLEQRGETQADFAVRVSTTPATISRLISGAFRPGLDLALLIEEVTEGAVPVNSWRPAKSSVGA